MSGMLGDLTYRGFVLGVLRNNRKFFLNVSCKFACKYLNILFLIFKSQDSWSLRYVYHYCCGVDGRNRGWRVSTDARQHAAFQDYRACKASRASTAIQANQVMSLAITSDLNWMNPRYTRSSWLESFLFQYFSQRETSHSLGTAFVLQYFLMRNFGNHKILFYLML